MRPSARIAILLSAILPMSVYSLVWQSVSLDELRVDARFIGSIVVESGQSQTSSDDPADVCGVSYTAIVTKSVLGPGVGKKISIHMLKDHRDDMRPGFLEVGSKYFIFAGDRKSHKFIQITDVYYGLEENVPEACHSDDDAFYVFSELSGKVTKHMGQEYLANIYIRQIEGVRKLESLYMSNENYDVFEDAISWREQMDTDLQFIGVNVEALLSFFAAKTE